MEKIEGYSVVFISEQGGHKKLFEYLNNNNFRVIKVREQVSKTIIENNPQLIIIYAKTKEYAMRTLNLLATLKEIQFIPRMVISSIKDTKSKIEILKLGVWNYIEDPFDYEELLATMNFQLLNSINISKLFQDNAKAKNNSIFDSLTGLYNRKYLMNRLVEEVSRAVRKGEDLSFAIIQMANYDEIGSLYGQSAVEYVIKEISIIIKQLVRLSDIIVRYSDKELGVLCPITDRTGLDIFFERLNSKINDSIFEYNGNIIKFTINIGGYTLESSDFSSFENKVSNMITFATEALERAINNQDDNREYY